MAHCSHCEKFSSLSASSPPTTQTNCLGCNTSVFLGEDYEKSYQKPCRNPDRQCSLIAPHQPSKLLCCRRFMKHDLPHDSMLAFPNYVLDLTYDNPQEDSFYNFHITSPDWSKTDRPVISWVLLQVTLVDGADISLLPVFWDIWSPWFLKDYGEWPCNVSQIS